MARRSPMLFRALRSGTTASLASSVALGLLARAEGRGVLQPLNATSHWRHGEAAAAVTRADLAHTATGYATHHAACVFWALFFEWATGPRPWPGRALRNAAVLSAVAAAVDYGATPRRFTPGWEFVLSKRAMAGAYAAMALGLGLGAAALAARR